MRPAFAMPESKAAVLWAVVCGAGSVSEVRLLTGYSRQVIWHRLRELHIEGLVLFPPGVIGGGALRPRVEVVRIL